MRQRCLILINFIILLIIVVACSNKGGGISLILGVKVEKAIESYLKNTVNSIKYTMNEKGIICDKLEKITDRIIQIRVVKEDYISETKNFLKEYLSFEIVNPVEDDKTVFLLILKPFNAEKIKVTAFDQVFTILRNRLIKSGISTPQIRKQDSNKITIILPELKTIRRIIDLISKTGNLEFKLMDNEANLNEISWDNIPPDDEILYGKSKAYLLKKQALMNGDVITEAKVLLSNDFKESFVVLKFDQRGATIFEEITANNIGRRLAIIFDKEVYSAPTIREKISGGYAMISRNLTSEEAHDLAIILGSSAYPVPVFILEQGKYSKP
ncbi:MAG: preprotein translocase subunit SecD [bacterium]